MNRDELEKRNVGENLDALMNLDPRGYGVCRILYAGSRKATGEPLTIANTNMFIEHIGTMINAIAVLDPASRPYANDGDALVREALWFCCRGLGLTDEAIRRHLDG